MSLISAATSLLTADAYSLVSRLFGASGWGIYYLGVPVVLADTVVALELQKSWQVSSFPIENGGFESYNKVYVPYRGRLRFTKGGSETDRQLFLASIEAIASGTTLLYDIVTPEAVYTNVTITAYGYRRSASSGLGLISVDVQAQEIRVSATEVTSTSSSATAAQTNTGTVQATDATTTQSSYASSIS